MPQHKENIKELEQLGAAHLLKGIQNPLSQPPAGYFNGLARQVAAQLEEAEKQSLGVLDTLPRTTVYPVPEGYFEQQPALLLETIRNMETREQKTPVRRLRVQRWLAAAGMALLISAGGYFFLHTPVRMPDPLQQLNTISDQDLAAYIEIDMDQVDAETLLQSRPARTNNTNNIP